jgi:hypothetical protein
MSNHFHLVLTDPEAHLPAFEQYLDSLVARAVNASLGRRESFWGPASYSAVALASAEDVIDKAGYVLANPAAAGLVPRGRDWPGLWSAPEQIGATPLAFRRPMFFFRARGAMPEEADLELSAPPGFASAAEFRERLVIALGEREERARRSRASEGIGFMGRRKVLAQRPHSRPWREEPRRKLNPRVAGRDKWKRIEALSRLSAFLDAYRVAWSAMRSGVRDVLFPAGTYGLRVSQGVRCAAPA